MSKHYADAEIEAVHEFAWQNRDQVKGFGSANAARRLLNRIAPAIAARALREAAAAIEPTITMGRYPEESAALHEREIIAESLRDRADEIEAGR